MVQSTGPANAEYLRGLVLQNNEIRESKQLSGESRILASSQWSAAANLALSICLRPSIDDLERLSLRNDEKSILSQMTDAVVTLKGVLEGKHDEEIDNTLNLYQVPRDRWWSAFYKVVEGQKHNIIVEEDH